MAFAPLLSGVPTVLKPLPICGGGKSERYSNWPASSKNVQPHTCCGIPSREFSFSAACPLPTWPISSEMKKRPLESTTRGGCPSARRGSQGFSRTRSKISRSLKCYLCLAVERSCERGGLFQNEFCLDTLCRR